MDHPAEAPGAGSARRARQKAVELRPTQLPRSIGGDHGSLQLAMVKARRDVQQRSLDGGSRDSRLCRHLRWLENPGLVEAHT